MESEKNIVPEATNEGFVENTMPDNVISEEKIEEEIVEKAEKPVENRCLNCQALLEEGMAFCPECGTSQKKICLKCGAELQEGQSFCHACGQKTENKKVNSNVDIVKKKSKKKYYLVIPIILCFIAIAVVVIRINAIKIQKINSYMSDAKEFASLAIEASKNLVDIAETAEDYWWDAIWDGKYDGDGDVAITHARLDKSKEIGTAEEQYDKMFRLYKKLRKVPDGVENESIDEICGTINEVYENYADFYSSVTYVSLVDREETTILLSRCRALYKLVY